jgi:putative Holliday junction resolvase
LGRLIALDYGLKRTGIAITDPMQIIASGLCTLPTPEVLDFLATYLKDEEVDGLVVGLPRQMDYSPSQVEGNIEKFIVEVRKRFPDLAIDRQDERFTSKMAVQAMVEGGVKKRKRKDKAAIDQISATLILQSYLSRK